ncbi:MAG: hypothetical protein NC308_01685 [Clostridium sp.]|nr:hypothetical protein [Bacteroides sp.]MCM1197578.1 hypothetical protein [Clostridium sp.]
MGKIFETVKTTLEELKFHYSIKSEYIYSTSINFPFISTSRSASNCAGFVNTHPEYAIISFNIK